MLFILVNSIAESVNGLKVNRRTLQSVARNGVQSSVNRGLLLVRLLPLRYHYVVNPRLFLNVDPRGLHLPSSRLAGPDPMKLQRQIARYGTSIHGMPPIEVY